ncbi:MAG: 30S ribosomal protein S17 [Candidatus Zambryskibacteria bacterium RIFCSPHIGHO2_01_FULL_43_27]|uniref:Small ribosomal subunit protein uS17 n=1 Tax=Candidatus Zambryskibacteria bacterium RIFCSPLOWO2_01_FULL_43_17 TaxID=1802760 RepID=A0A1G2U437_9BACT|nr:MAG: 30S ribosomal protein S17 [Candidatus Zambryskibacteria bacterium RIFCSPHIGHO2_01_FULL_43_27]OHB00024.1 MAG: 30S ribosomal protein S17 [Candidatus Zambryskibacteria bacterium RIFCSPHIGHO2_12_FULL_43_12b]OHB04256.1 MAG: 30S ribosomal protein S17 [Candidatus Zambryskibacteria bacterium RIFCSPLOWO2_01_FULL_43_17]
MSEKENKIIKRGKMLKGTAVSNKMKDTVVVEVERYVKHPQYGKYIRKRKKIKAHDAGNTVNIGDKVVIEECKPISKDKRFVVVRVA